MTTLFSQLQQLTQTYKQLGLEQAVNYEKFCMMSIVWHSTKIEGCSLTETDTKVLLEHGLTAAGKPLQDHLMVKDHFEAFLFIQEQAQQKRKLSLPFIQEIGAKVMQHTGGKVNTVLGNFDVAKGDFRLTQVYVDRKYFPHYQKIPKLLQQFCQSINQQLEAIKPEEVVLLAADAHYQFVNIHPFTDSNGRTARLLMNYIQIYHQEPLIKMFSEDRTAYIDTLNDAEAQKELAIFRRFIAQQQIKFLQAEIAKYKQMNKGFLF